MYKVKLWTGLGTSPLPVGGCGSGWRWLLAPVSLSYTPAVPAVEPAGCGAVCCGEGESPEAQASRRGCSVLQESSHSGKPHVGRALRWVPDRELVAITARCCHWAQRLLLSPPQTVLPPAGLRSRQDTPSNTSSAAPGMGQPAALAHAARHHQAAHPPCAVSVCPSHQQSGPTGAPRTSPCPERPGCAPGQQQSAQPHGSRGSGQPQAPLVAPVGWQWQHEEDGPAWVRVAALPVPPGVHRGRGEAVRECSPSLGGTNQTLSSVPGDACWGFAARYLCPHAQMLSYR